MNSESLSQNCTDIEELKSYTSVEELIVAYKQKKLVDINNINIVCTLCDEKINNFILSDYTESNEIMCKKHCVQNLKNLLGEFEEKSRLERIESIKTIYNIILTNMHVLVNFNHPDFLKNAIYKIFELIDLNERFVDTQNLRCYLRRWMDIVTEIVPREFI